jgi:hypothetical protein
MSLTLFGDEKLHTPEAGSYAASRLMPIEENWHSLIVPDKSDRHHPGTDPDHQPQLAASCDTPGCRPETGCATQGDEDKSR